jgi:hypothetical protein
MAKNQHKNIVEHETREEADSIEYQHSLLCSLTLPRSKPPNREYTREGQGRILRLEAGSLWDGKKLAPQPLPYGPKARLAFMHICSEAIKSKSHAIEIEGSARGFMERIGIENPAGSQYRLFRQQMNALAACRFILGYTNLDGKLITTETKPIKDFEAWLARDSNKRSILWASCLQLSYDFYQDLIKHAVPLSANALRGLSNSALALDYYGFFAYRLHALEKPVIVSWKQLHNQLGQEYATSKDFKRWSLPMIKAALEVYPSAKVEQVKGGLMLKPSPPPIARQSISISQGLADTVKANLSIPTPTPPAAPRLHYKTIEKFKALYPRKDVYACEADFRYWLETSPGAESPRSYDAAFLGFAKRWSTQG